MQQKKGTNVLLVPQLDWRAVVWTTRHTTSHRMKVAGVSDVTTLQFFYSLSSPSLVPQLFVTWIVSVVPCPSNKPKIYFKLKGL